MMISSENILIIFYVFFILMQSVQSEFFTAVAEMEKLLRTEEEIVKSLENYVNLEEIRLSKVKRLRKMFAELNKTAKKDPEAFLANPVNAFLLVKRLTTDWNVTNTLIKSTDSLSDLVYTLSSPEIVFPGDEDLNGAAVALMRLQNMYLINTSSIASGHLKEGISSHQLTASDCFELGRQAYEVRYTNHTLMWMQESLRRLETEEIPSVAKTDVLEYMAYVAYDRGNFSEGLKLTQGIVEINPYYPHLLANLQYYKARLDEWKETQTMTQTANDSRDDGEEDDLIMIRGRGWSEKELIQRYHKLCRGEKFHGIEKKAYCYLTTQNNSYFQLQPIKVEELSTDPRIVLFHDVISDKEIEVVKTIAMPELQRAIVTDVKTGKSEYSTDRISKSALIEDEEHELLSKLSKRIEDITGLTTETAEAIQVINYGVGGHYDPHFDFAQTKAKIEMFELYGNRIATWIFYLSDIQAGGSTVFPVIGVEVKPVKGAAGFWYNLERNGEGDKRTMHAACPVLVGSKWIANKWLHEFGNEFRRPCSLNATE